MTLKDNEDNKDVRVLSNRFILMNLIEPLKKKKKTGVQTLGNIDKDTHKQKTLSSCIRGNVELKHVFEKDIIKT